MRLSIFTFQAPSAKVCRIPISARIEFRPTLAPDELVVVCYCCRYAIIWSVAYICSAHLLFHRYYRCTPHSRVINYASWITLRIAANSLCSICSHNNLRDVVVVAGVRPFVLFHVRISRGRQTVDNVAATESRHTAAHRNVRRTNSAHRDKYPRRRTIRRSRCNALWRGRAHCCSPGTCFVVHLSCVCVC